MKFCKKACFSLLSFCFGITTVFAADHRLQRSLHDLQAHPTNIEQRKFCAHLLESYGDVQKAYTLLGQALVLHRNEPEILEIAKSNMRALWEKSRFRYAPENEISGVEKVFFSPDGRWITLQKDGSLVFRDPDNLAEIGKRIETNSDAHPADLFFSPVGICISKQTDESWVFRNPDTLEEIGKRIRNTAIRIGGIRYLAEKLYFLQNGKWVTSHVGGFFAFRDPRTFRKIGKTINFNKDPRKGNTSGFFVSKNGMVATTQEDGSFSFRDPATLKEIGKTIEYSGPIYQVLFLPNEKILTHGFESRFVIHEENDFSKIEYIDGFEQQERIIGTLLSPDEGELIIQTRDMVRNIDRFSVRNLNSLSQPGQIFYSHTSHPDPINMQYSPEGKLILLDSSGRLQVWKKSF